MNVKRDSNKSLSKELLKTTAIVLGFAICTKFLFFDFLQLEGDSMLETLKSDEKVLVNKAIYKINEPRRGDVIVFNYPNNRYFKLIKRVIAIEGDTIEICGGKVVVNDIILEEKYIREKFIEDFEKKVVPKNCVFVMGDNRNNSKDSRFEEVGFVEHRFIKGKAIIVIWPIRRIRKII